MWQALPLVNLEHAPVVRCFLAVNAHASVRFIVCPELLLRFCQRVVGAARRLCHGGLRSGGRPHQHRQHGPVSPSLRQPGVALHYLCAVLSVGVSPSAVSLMHACASSCGSSSSAYTALPE